MPRESAPATDRRVLRTQHLLHAALGSLIHEKPYRAIAVKEILGRANVGRSTFYSHYRDKDELLLGGIQSLLHSVRPARSARSAQGSDPLWFSRPLFEHIDQRRGGSGARLDVDGRAVVHGHLQDAVTELMLDELRQIRRRDDGKPSLPDALLARHVAATFVLVLDWWMQHAITSTVSEIDAYFRTLVGRV